MKTKNQTHITTLPGGQDILIVREFEAPREKVFRAFTDPAILGQWLMTAPMKARIDRWDTFAGGQYRYVFIDPSGNELGSKGMVHEYLVPERIIQTYEFEPLPEKGHVQLRTTRFETLPNDRTRVQIQILCQSEADRDGMIGSSMEPMLKAGHEVLDGLLEKM